MYAEPIEGYRPYGGTVRKTLPPKRGTENSSIENLTHTAARAIYALYKGGGGSVKSLSESPEKLSM